MLPLRAVLRRADPAREGGQVDATHPRAEGGREGGKKSACDKKCMFIPQVRASDRFQKSQICEVCEGASHQRPALGCNVPNSLRETLHVRAPEVVDF